MWTVLSSEVTLFEYIVSTILSPIVVLSHVMFTESAHLCRTVMGYCYWWWPWVQCSNCYTLDRDWLSVSVQGVAVKVMYQTFFFFWYVTLFKLLWKSFFSSFLLYQDEINSRTSHNRLPNTWRVGGYLQEVSAYESQTAGGLLRGEVQANLFFKENVLHAIFRLQWIICKISM